MSLRLVAHDVSKEVVAAFAGKNVAPTDSMVGTIAVAATGAIKDAGNLIKTRGRANIAAAGFSVRWRNTWRTIVYPKTGYSINAAVWAFHKIPYSSVFEEGATIRPKSRSKLWLPLKTTPLKGIGRGRTTPRMLVEKGINLYPINRPGKPPLLAANIPAFDPKARRRQRLTLRKVRSALLGKGAAGGKAVRSVPLFVGLNSVTIRKRLDIAGVADGVRAELGELYFANLKTVE